jgi:hypothetical protein
MKNRQLENEIDGMLEKMKAIDKNVKCIINVVIEIE